MWCLAPPLPALLTPMFGIVQYASMLAEKMQTHGATAWLVNTGWTAGPYGIGCVPRTQFLLMMTCSLTALQRQRTGYPCGSLTARVRRMRSPRGLRLRCLRSQTKTVMSAQPYD